MRKEVIGNCELYLGDCMEILPVLGTVDAVVTDPPYGMNKGFLNDNVHGNRLIEFNKKWIERCLSLLKDAGAFYIFGNDISIISTCICLWPFFDRHELTFGNIITWVKNVAQGINNKQFMVYTPQDEKILYFMKGFHRNLGNSRKTDFFEGYEPVRSYLETEYRKAGLNQTKMKAITGGTGRHFYTKTGYEFCTGKTYTALQKYYKNKYFSRPYDQLKADYIKAKQRFKAQRPYFNNLYTSVWNISAVSGGSKERCHPTQKPAGAITRALECSTRKNEIILDPFMGSGTTGVACVETGRKFAGIEINEKYFDAACRRIEAAARQPLLEAV